MPKPVSVYTVSGSYLPDEMHEGGRMLSIIFSPQVAGMCHLPFTTQRSQSLNRRCLCARLCVLHMLIEPLDHLVQSVLDGFLCRVAV